MTVPVVARGTLVNQQTDMCLYDSKRFRINGIKPIKVYKVVRVAEDGTFRTPYVHKPFKKTMFGGFKGPVKHCLAEDYCFEGGFIHACLTYEYAQVLAWDVVPKSSIFVGYVPPFTRYAIEDDYKICSRWMIFTREIRT